MDKIKKKCHWLAVLGLQLMALAFAAKGYSSRQTKAHWGQTSGSMVMKKKFCSNPPKRTPLSPFMQKKSRKTDTAYLCLVTAQLNKQLHACQQLRRPKQMLQTQNCLINGQNANFSAKNHSATIFHPKHCL